MIHQFPLHQRAFFSGKAVLEQGRWQIIHPVKITAVGSLVPIYKTPLRVDVMRRLIEKHDYDRGSHCRWITQNIAQTLYDIHFPKIPMPL